MELLDLYRNSNCKEVLVLWYWQNWKNELSDITNVFVILYGTCCLSNAEQCHYDLCMTKSKPTDVLMEWLVSSDVHDPDLVHMHGIEWLQASGDGHLRAVLTCVSHIHGSPAVWVLAHLLHGFQILKHNTQCAFLNGNSLQCTTMEDPTQSKAEMLCEFALICKTVSFYLLSINWTKWEVM